MIQEETMNNKLRLRKWVGTALLGAIIVVLQTFASGIKIGPFTPTLSLIPIIIGAIVYGPLSGAILGLVFGVVVIIAVFSGAEAMSTMMLTQNPFMTVFLCLFKGAMAGLVPGVIYRTLHEKNDMMATALAAISAPVMNTGIFSIALLTVFRSIADQFAQALNFTGAGQFIVLGIIGTNFLFELAVNVILVPVVKRIVKAID